MTTVALREVGLEDKYLASEGTVLLTGIQALVRLALDQRRLDDRRGLNTRLFISGYQGSPLGGLDRELSRASEHLDAAGVVFRPAVNEELAATAVAGTQLLGELDRRRCDGVSGLWYGKNPGLDRAADAIRHGNVVGTTPLGGAVALVGDDPASKSSTLPSACEPMCRSLLMPVLAPGTVEELLSFGLHAINLSRFAGLWSAVKVISDVADATATVDVGTVLDAIPDLERSAARAVPTLLPPTNLDAEADLMERRLIRASEYSSRAGLNRRVVDTPRPRLTIIAAGAALHAALRAFHDLVLDPGALASVGVRLIALGMPWPLHREEIVRLIEGSERVLVIEDKLPFLETHVKESLYGHPQAPTVLGQHDADGRPLVPVRGALEADDLHPVLARVLSGLDLPELVRERLASPVPQRLVRDLPSRTPYFCSGCPHNLSTRAEPDELVGVGIGCHAMVVLDEGERRGRLVGMTQMGGEGAQWLGLAPFTEDRHFIQNLGDGTFHHSGSLAIRAAVAAGVSLTYKLLYNDAVAMTGGQRPEGRMDVPTLTRWLAEEGVVKTVVLAAEPRRYRHASLPSNADVRHRDKLADTERELARVRGVTVLLYDDMCATERRRLRRRGKLPTPADRVWINERVCEGCGDCGDQSSCLSVVPISTEFGRKTQIHQSSCNHDRSCLKGDCPSFVLITPNAVSSRSSVPEPPPSPPPDRQIATPVLIRMPGVGGTGVVTVSQVLQMAAHLSGLSAAGLEQTGLAQKGGPVVSDVRIAQRAILGQVRASRAGVDVLLGLDLLGAAAPATLDTCDPARTAAIVNITPTATAAMVTDPAAPPQPTGRALRRIREAVRADAFATLDAGRLSQLLFDDHMQANTIMLGAAFERGLLPVSDDAIERAIGLNGAAVEENIAAFRWGRAAVAHPASVEALLAPHKTRSSPSRAARSVLASLPDDVGEELRRLLGIRVPELVAYQNRALARSYLADVLRVAEIESRRTPHSTLVAETYARGLYKLMAYKDEYEVARLHLHPDERAAREAAFGAGTKTQLLLHPPTLRALGLNRKLRFGSWSRPLLVLLRVGRRLRGSRLDPFSYSSVRRVERQLADEYRALVDTALEYLEPATVGQVVEIAALPDEVRGFEQIKMQNVEKFRLAASELLFRLGQHGD